MRLAKIIPLALVGASLAACEPTAPGAAKAEPHTLPATSASSSDAKPVAVAASRTTVQASVRQPAPEVVSDAFITGAVRAAMMGDPGLQGSDVSVNTSHGVVSLTGRVKSREQAAIAAAHAEGEDGVMRVDNTLVVLND
jgi:hyperosmotically inducible periplasmic protein